MYVMELLQKFRPYDFAQGRQSEPDSFDQRPTSLWLAQLTLKLRHKFPKIKSLFLQQKTALTDGFRDSTKVESNLAYHLLDRITQITQHVKFKMRGGDGICTRRTLDDKPGSPLRHPHTTSVYHNFSLRLPRPSLRSVLAMTLLFSMILHSLFILPSSVYAASSPWSQTNWNGGSGQTSWSDTTKYDSSSSVTTSTANQVTLTATSSWYNASWAYRKKIPFDNSAQAENLTNFPVLVKLSSSNFDFTKAQSAGQDIRFTDSDGTTLNISGSE